MLAAVKESAVSFDAKTTSTLHEKRKLASAKKSFYGANNDSMQNIKLHKHALDMAASKLKRNASQKRKDPENRLVPYTMDHKMVFCQKGWIYFL